MTVKDAGGEYFDDLELEFPLLLLRNPFKFDPLIFEDDDPPLYLKYKISCKIFFLVNFNQYAYLVLSGFGNGIKNSLCCFCCELLGCDAIDDETLLDCDDTAAEAED